MFRPFGASLVLAVGLCAGVSVQTSRAPRIWDEAALADWATPVATLNVRPGHYSAAEYYAAPLENLKTYPVYHPDREPPGYWEQLQKLAPAPLVEPGLARSDADWIATGQRVFGELDLPGFRTNAPDVIASIRDPRTFDGVQTMDDGTVFGPRWVVTAKGVMLSGPACSACHRYVDTNNKIILAGPGGSGRGNLARLQPASPVNGPVATFTRIQQIYPGDNTGTMFWREYTVPWAPDDRIEGMKGLSQAELQAATGPGGLVRSFSNGVFSRTNGSPYFATKIMDLQNLRYSRYMDATGTHRLRGPADVARYAALVTGADSLEFGTHRILSPEQRRVPFRYADEILYAIGMFVMSLEPPKNPAPASRELVDRGRAIFDRESCAECHRPPNYTSGMLTLAAGWTPPADHPNRADILPRTANTDPGLALKTRKGTGFYKIPSLRGVWYRPRLLHDGSLTSLEEMFGLDRFEPTYRPRGWNPPGVDQRAVTGHTFGTALRAEDKAALLAFLRSL